MDDEIPHEIKDITVKYYRYYGEDGVYLLSVTWINGVCSRVRIAKTKNPLKTDPAPRARE